VAPLLIENDDDRRVCEEAQARRAARLARKADVEKNRSAAL
jgi:hypothetical protein